MQVLNLDQFQHVELHPSDFTRYIPDFDIKKIPGSNRDELKKSAIEYLRVCKKNIQYLHQENYHAEHLIGLNSQMTDRFIINLFKWFDRQACKKYSYTGPKLALVAVGGYGREEMNVASDIDLLFLSHKRKDPYVETLTENLLYLLWDLKLDVGYATRTPSECLKLATEDVTIFTSLIDRRFLWGNKEQFEKLNILFEKNLSQKSVIKRFVNGKLEERKTRVKKHGKSVFVLEPNVKETAGGLRDLHLLLWLSHALGKGNSLEALAKNSVITPAEKKALIVGRNFIWRIRDELHLLNKRKSDLLTFGHQPQVAKNMAFKDDPNGILAVERFMQTYYQMAYQISSITEKVIRKLCQQDALFQTFLQKIKTKKVDENFRLVEDQITPKNNEVLKKPYNILKLYYHVQKLGVKVNPETGDFIRMHAKDIVDEEFINDKKAIALFDEILSQYTNLGRVLRFMHEHHFLDYWMPEWQKLRCRVQHDAYHIYTIDTHSIFAVEELSKLASGHYRGKFDFYQKVLQEIKEPKLLTLGLFLHDIGKGEGGNHHIKGARIAKSITKRLNFSKEQKEVIDFLITSHLMMPHLSQRRDLEDQELIARFADNVQSLDRLNMLFLLTWGDIRAVGPEAWTDWKGSLLTKLYEKTKEMLESNEHSEKATEAKILDHKKELKAAIDQSQQEPFASFLAQMPPRYFFAHPSEEILWHFEAFRKQADKSFIFESRLHPSQTYAEVMIFTINSIKILAWVTGVLLAYEINILRVDLIQTYDGHALVHLKLAFNQKQNGVGDFTQSDFYKKCEKLKVDLHLIITGQKRIEDLLQKRKLPEYLEKKPIQKAKPKVVIDNHISAYYTVIDVYAHDRLGLLHEIVRTLNDLGLFVEVSKISTKVEQVVDAFYVKDIFGHKITSNQRLRSIKEELISVIS